MNQVKIAQNENTAGGKGQLQVNVTSSVDNYPVADARISISYTGIPGGTLEQLDTESSGQTETVDLDAPPVEYSLDCLLYTSRCV